MGIASGKTSKPFIARQTLIKITTWLTSQLSDGIFNLMSSSNKIIDTVVEYQKVSIPTKIKIISSDNSKID